jgi:hypothetical protein
MSSNETADEVFGRIVEAGLSSKSGGNIDSATGYFSVVEIPDKKSAARADMRYCVFSNDKEDIAIFDGLRAGWYFVTLRTGDDPFYYPCDSKETAYNEFRQIQDYFDSFEEMDWGY